MRSSAAANTRLTAVSRISKSSSNRVKMRVESFYDGHLDLWRPVVCCSAAGSCYETMSNRTNIDLDVLLLHQSRRRRSNSNRYGVDSTTFLAKTCLILRRREQRKGIRSNSHTYRRMKTFSGSRFRFWGFVFRRNSSPFGFPRIFVPSC